VKTTKEAQIIFLDTPGLHDSKKALNRKMIKAAADAARDADVLLFLSDATLADPEEEINRAKNLMRHKKPVVVAINKIDIVKKDSILPLIKRWSEAGFETIFPISALNGEGLDELEREVTGRLPHGPKLFPDETITEQTERFLTAEVIREKLFKFTQMEIPYSSAVLVEEFKERSETLTAVRAVIYVEKNSQKPIVIGQNGSMIKKIGTAARKELEERFDRKFYLELNVKVRKDWTREEKFIRRLDEQFGS
jgi:GTP-binding protein Era